VKLDRPAGLGPTDAMLQSGCGKCRVNLFAALGEMRPAFEVEGHNRGGGEGARSFDGLLSGHGEMERAHFRHAGAAPRLRIAALTMAGSAVFERWRARISTRWRADRMLRP